MLDLGCHDNEDIERIADALQYQAPMRIGTAVVVAELHSVKSPSVVCSLVER